MSIDNDSLVRICLMSDGQSKSILSLSKKRWITPPPFQYVLAIPLNSNLECPCAYSHYVDSTVIDCKRIFTGRD